MSNPLGFSKMLTDDLLGNTKFNFTLRKYTIRYCDDNGNDLHEDTEYDEWVKEQKEINRSFKT